MLLKVLNAYIYIDTNSHAGGGPVAPCITEYPLTILFCVVNRRPKKVKEA